MLCKYSGVDKMSKKEMLAKVIDTILPDKLYRYLSLLSGHKNKLTVLAYHRIMDVDENFPFDIELISASCKQFEEQINFVSKYFTPITIEQLVECYNTSTALPEKSVLITFDDGFEDNYKNAFPILEKFNVPATIFLSTDYISSNKTLWFDRLAYFILNSDEDIFRLVLESKFNIKNNYENRRSVLEEVMEYVKHIPNSEREILLDDMYSKYHFEYKDNHKHLSTTLTWEQIKEMDKSNISFGSHTLSHPILSQLTESELDNELFTSKSILEKHLGHPVETIAYPVGTEAAFNKKVINYTKKAGYLLGFSYIAGVNAWPLKQQYSIKRLHVERYVSTSLFKCMLSIPKVFSS